MKKLAYLLVASVFLGAHLLAIPLGIAQLSMYRLMIGIAVLALIYRLIIKDPKYTFSIGHAGEVTPYQLIYLFWLVYAFISVFWVESLSRWGVGMFFVGCGIFSIVYISYHLRKEDELKNVFLVMFWMTVMHHVLAWIEILTSTYFFTDVNTFDKYNTFHLGPLHRIPITTFGNQNDFSTMILAGIFVGFILLKNSKKIIHQLWLVLYLISGTLLIYQSGSRGNLLALILGMVVYVVLKSFDYTTSKKIFYVFFIGLAGVVFSILFIPPIQDRVISIIGELLQGPIRPGASNRNRINMVLNGFYFLLRTFGFGVGAGNIEHWMVYKAPLPVDAPNIHNWFMEILSAYGIIVFVLYIAMYVFILRRLFINYLYSKDPFIKNTSHILFAYLIAFIISSISSASNIIIEWQWVFFGIIIAFVQYTERVSLDNDSYVSDKNNLGV